MNRRVALTISGTDNKQQSKLKNEVWTKCLITCGLFGSDFTTRFIETQVKTRTRADWCVRNIRPLGQRGRLSTVFHCHFRWLSQTSWSPLCHYRHSYCALRAHTMISSNEYGIKTYLNISRSRRTLLSVIFLFAAANSRHCSSSSWHGGNYSFEILIQKTINQTIKTDRHFNVTAKMLCSWNMIATFSTKLRTRRFSLVSDRKENQSVAQLRVMYYKQSCV